MTTYKFTDDFTIGLDEVGRGTLFGNVVACGVIMPSKFDDDIYLQIKDSKKLSKKKREVLAEYIKKNAIAYHICEINPEEIDKINILQASIKAMTNCVREIMKTRKVNKLIVDGNHFNPIMSNDEDEDKIIDFVYNFIVDSVDDYKKYSMKKQNDFFIPILMYYAKTKGYNIISFWGGDYGGADEFVVDDISRYTKLSDIWKSVN